MGRPVECAVGALDQAGLGTVSSPSVTVKLCRTSNVACALATLAETSTPTAMAAAKPRSGKSLEGFNPPINVGLDWIPFMFLSMPWYALDVRLLVPGLVLNAGLMYLVRTLLRALWRRI